MDKFRLLAAQRLKQAIDRAGISQKELSIISGVSPSSISQYLNGRAIPSFESSVKLGNALKVNSAWLMGYEMPINAAGGKFGNIGQSKILEKLALLDDIDIQKTISYIDFLLTDNKYSRE